MGATLIDGGATFRLWAPMARSVHVNYDDHWLRDGETAAELVRDGEHWTGFIPGIRAGTQYQFWVVGEGSAGYKRDPYARELASPWAFPGSVGYPACNCVVRDPNDYPWHDQGFVPPAFGDLIIYQLHVGRFYAVDAQGHDMRPTRVATFLDVLDRLEYLVALGVTAIEPLPVVQYDSPRSLGYNSSDLFSPEQDYAADPADLPHHLRTVNRLLAQRGRAPLAAVDLQAPVNQLRALIDLCHVYGLAVLLDVVYNHAGGEIEGQDQTLWYLDRQRPGDHNRSLYFTANEYSGGPCFALWKQEVRQFLIDNATFLVGEYHVDGLRYDQISALVANSTHDGWRFCQDLTDTLRHAAPSAVQVAEYWPVDPAVVGPAAAGGAGFDATWHDGLRNAVRGALGAAAVGRHNAVDLDAVADALRSSGLADAWRAVQALENHDLVYARHNEGQRIPRLADGGNARSWYGRSRSRVATGLLLTAPGIPLLFMGQEFLEDKQWSDNTDAQPDTLIWWQGLEGGDTSMVDHLRFTQDLIRLRRRLPALRGEPIRVFHTRNMERVVGFHRWLEARGEDVVVVASLNEATLRGYRLGFPGPGRWAEVFNSDVYDHWVNPAVAGNGGGVTAVDLPWDDMPCSAELTVPANGLLVFARDG